MDEPALPGPTRPAVLDLKLAATGQALFGRGKAGWQYEANRYRAGGSMLCRIPMEEKETLLPRVAAVLGQLGIDHDHYQLQPNLDARALVVRLPLEAYRDRISPLLGLKDVGMLTSERYAMVTAPEPRSSEAQAVAYAAQLWKQALFRHGREEWHEDADRREYCFTGGAPLEPAAQHHAREALALLSEELQCQLHAEPLEYGEHLYRVTVDAAAFDTALSPKLGEHEAGQLGIGVHVLRQRTRQADQSQGIG